jgi:hypothetical protein
MQHSPSWEANRPSINTFPAFYGTQRFITVFTRAHHLYLSWARPMQSKPHTTSWRLILILSSHLRFGLPSVCFPSLRFPHQNPALFSPLHHTCYMSRPSGWFEHLNNIWGGVLFPLRDYILPLSRTYLVLLLIWHLVSVYLNVTTTPYSKKCLNW